MRGDSTHRVTGVASLPGHLELPYVEQGEHDGIPVLLLHGLADSWRSFEAVLAHLPDSIHALAVTQRGHGSAGRPAVGYEVEDFARDVGNFLDAVGLDRTVIVASSSATFTAQRFAVDNAARVLGLVLIGVPWSLGDMPAARRILESVADLQDPVDPVFVREFVEETAGARVPAEMLESMVGESLKLPARVWRETLAGLIRETPAAATGQIEAPALILWGEHDPFVPKSDQQRLLEALPKSRLVVYESSGHVLHWEQPTRVAADIAEFVTLLDP